MSQTEFTELSLDAALGYLKTKYNCKIFQHSESYYSFRIACFVDGEIHPVHKIIVRKHPESQLRPGVAKRIHKYEQQSFASWKVIKFEEIVS